jgi:TetR/AcrR family transcriptional repressor of mexJK operon
MLQAPDTASQADAGARPAHRRAHYVALAREMFFAQGYGATSMSALAARAGGSKTTLWALFPSKQALFEAVVDDIVEHYGQALVVDLASAPDLAAGLTAMGLAYMDTVLSPPVINMLRLVTGEAGRFPELARTIHEKGPMRGRARLAEFLAAAQQRGWLAPGNAELAATHFIGLCRCHAVEQAILGVTPPPDAPTRAAETALAVRAFLGGWGLSGR